MKCFSFLRVTLILLILACVLIPRSAMVPSVTKWNEPSQWWMSEGRWKMVGGWGVNGSWDSTMNRIRTLRRLKNKVFAAVGRFDPPTAEVWELDSGHWNKVGGDGLKGSWSNSGYNGVLSMSDDKKNLYVGLGDHPGDADVWRFDGLKWEQIGGDGVNKSWRGNFYDGCKAMAFFQGELYVAVNAEHIGVNQALLYKFNPLKQSWTFVTGLTGERGGWDLSSGYYTIYRIKADAKYMYLGMAGRKENSAAVWRFNGSVFEQIGGASLNGSWNSESSKFVYDLTLYDRHLVASVTGSVHPIWKFNGVAWEKLGNFPVEFLRNDTLNTLYGFGPELFLSAGGGPGTASIWRLMDNQWKLIGGHGMNGSRWEQTPRQDEPQSKSWVYSMRILNDLLIVGFAGSTPGSGQVWGYPLDFHHEQDPEVILPPQFHSASSKTPQSQLDQIH